MKAAIIAGCVVLSVLATASGALAAEPNEHWRCGPFDINIIPGDSYVPGENIVLNNDEGFMVRKNGHDAGHSVIRARMYEIEKGACEYHSCPNGARTAYWSGITRGGKYNGSGELLTIDGITHYTENLLSGKDESRVLRTEKHICRRLR